MAVLKCKMCGGTLEIESETVATCKYCGTKLPVYESGGVRPAMWVDISRDKD